MAASSAATFDWSDGTAAGQFRLTGALSIDTAAAILARGSRAFAAAPQVSVDLSGITQADSAGLSVLLAWVGRARREGRRLSFTSLPEPLLRIARLCAVEPLLSAAG